MANLVNANRYSANFVLTVWNKINHSYKKGSPNLIQKNHAEKDKNSF